MNLKDIFVKCTPDTVDFLKSYIYFMYTKIMDGKLIENYEVFLDGKDYDDLKRARIYYFIALLLASDLDIKKYIRLTPIVKNLIEYDMLPFEELKAEVKKYTPEEMAIIGISFDLNGFLDKVISKNVTTISIARILLNIIELGEIDLEIAPIVDAFSLELEVEALEKIAHNEEIVETINNQYLDGQAKEEMDAMINRFKENQTRLQETLSFDDRNPIDALAEDTLKEKLQAKGLPIAGINIRLPKESVDVPNATELTGMYFLENPLVGRTKELRQMGASLLDEEKSVVLYGKPGVGKTTLVRGLAYQIARGISHPAFKDYKIYETSAASLVSGTSLRGEFEEKLLKLIKDIIKSGKAYLFIDEMHTIMGAGTGNKENTLDASNILKPYLGDGRLKIIGGTTEEEYALLLANGAFSRRFIGIPIPELEPEAVKFLLERKILSFKEKLHIGFPYPEDVKQEILNVYLSLANEQYQNADKRLYNPDLALTLLRMGYNFARYDNKSNVDVDSLIEGLEMIKEVSPEGREYFKSRVREITR